jgi:RNA ligase (TIGR02306 family)
MDGSSITVFYVDGDKYNNQGWGYCSRNQELKMPALEGTIDVSQEGKFLQGAFNSFLFSKVVSLHQKFGSYYAIQGELVGAGIQGNFEKFDTYQVFAYNIFDIEKQEYVDYNTFTQMAEAVDLQICPVVYEEQYILQESLEDILAMANGTGLKADYREGLVWKQADGNLQFKAISNRYLEKQE